jgi:hypothetical protein
MDKLTQETWDDTVSALSNSDEGLRDHFGKLILLLAKCYNPDLPHKAVVIIDTGESLLTFCAGADEMELAEMLGQANDMAQALTMRDAPPKELFN